MAYAPISLTMPQYEDYPNYWLKAYEQGTTTPLAMATDASAATTLAKAELDSTGFPVTAGNVRFIPFLNASYDLWLFPTEGEADGNITVNAIQLADNLNTTQGSLDWGTSETATQVSIASYRIAGADVTAEHHVGRRVEMVGGSTVYGTINASSFSTDTTVTVTVDAGGSIPADLASVSLGPNVSNASSQGQYYLPLTGETNIENHAFAVNNLFRYIPLSLHAGIIDRTDTTDLSAYITNAVNNAYTLGLGSVEAPDATYNIKEAGVTIPAGVTLWGNSSASEYYPAAPSNPVHGAVFLKPALSTAGPVFILSSSSFLKNCYVKHLTAGGATTGIIQVGVTGTSTYRAGIRGVSLYGAPQDDVSGANTCYGIYFPDGSVATTVQRYFNTFEDFTITNCDIGIHLGANCNGNGFNSYLLRNCYIYHDLIGTSATELCVENQFSGIRCFWIGAAPSVASIVFKQRYAQWNNFSGYVTECQGAEHDADSTVILGTFDGLSNEVTASYIEPNGIAGPASGNATAKFQQPINVSQHTQMVLPIATTGDRFDQVNGSKISMFQMVDGTGDGLPALNDATGVLAAADADSRVIMQFNASALKKNAEPNFRCKLTVFVNAAGTSGQTMCTVDFSYITTNTSTDAGLLKVHNVDLTPAASNYISGLKFIDGATGGTEFRIAMVGGNLSATLASRVAVSLEMDVYKQSVIATNDYVNIGFVSTAATVNDVTDAIDLLTVAETVV